MRPGDTDHYAEALWVTLDKIARKPTDFTFAEISNYAALAADELRPKPKKSQRQQVEGQRTVDDELGPDGYIHCGGTPSVHE